MLGGHEVDIDENLCPVPAPDSLPCPHLILSSDPVDQVSLFPTNGEETVDQGG